LDLANGSHGQARRGLSPPRLRLVLGAQHFGGDPSPPIFPRDIDPNRAYGRTPYHSGVDIVTISHILGHDNISTTIRYLGINKDDLDKAVRIHGEYQRRMLEDCC